MNVFEAVLAFAYLGVWVYIVMLCLASKRSGQ
jgi:hypothetical protein